MRKSKKNVVLSSWISRTVGGERSEQVGTIQKLVKYRVEKQANLSL